MGGKLYDSTIGEVITEDVQIEINSSYEVQNVILAGQIVCGTHPHQAVNGVFIGADAVVGGNVTSASAFLASAAAIDTDGLLDIPEEITSISSLNGVFIGADAVVGGNVTSASAFVPLSGTVPGQSTESVMIGSCIEAGKSVPDYALGIDFSLIPGVTHTVLKQHQGFQPVVPPVIHKFS